MRAEVMHVVYVSINYERHEINSYGDEKKVT
jgi:hypothetical protein